MVIWTNPRGRLYSGSLACRTFLEVDPRLNLASKAGDLPSDKIGLDKFYSGFLDLKSHLSNRCKPEPDKPDLYHFATFVLG